LCVIYRPPNSTDQYNSSLLTYLNSLVILDGTKNILLIGDINFPEINWSIYSGNSPTTDDLAEAVYGLNLIQYMTGLTHRTGNTL